MIIFDTETTDLVSPEASNINRQPRIIEFAAIKADTVTLKEVARLESLIDPGIPIPAESTKITGITDKTVAGKPKFAQFYKPLAGFFLGEDTLLAHNLPFDKSVLKYELTRIDKQFSFPWPITGICTVENSIGLKGYRLSLSALYELAFNKPMKEAHRAMIDVEALLECVRWMRKKKLL